MKTKYLIAAAAMLGLSTAAWSAPAPRFLQDAVSGDNGEIAIGRLAQQRGSSHEAVEFGRTLESDHSAARTQALQTAREMGVHVQSGAMKPEAMQLRRRLSRLSGPAFDREFATAMIADHRKDIAKFEMQQRTGDRATSRLAAETLPHLRHHLEMAMAIPRH